ncbi:MAG: rod shape-determining protein MreC [Caulobacter sp.]|nr:rod shape-determining protein MreC [Caulobacter sp.]
MAFRQDSFGELKVPLAWTAGVALVVCVVIAIALMLSDRRGTVEGTAQAATQQVADTVVTPVGDVLSTPGRWISGGFDFIGSYWNSAGENRRLKAELQEARRAEDRATALGLENARLRAMLNVRTDPPMPMVTARVVFDGRGPFRRAQLANAGTDKGVAIGYPVISERGVIGRVVGVSGNASRILLLKDVSSRTPVMIARTNARAILTGDGGDNPRLDNLRGADPVKPGDRVLTSGDGGVYPGGLPVGRAVRGLDGKWRVALDSDTAPVDWVRILQFKDFSQLADRKALANSDMPSVITDAPSSQRAPSPTPRPSTPSAAQPPPATPGPAARPPISIAPPTPAPPAATPPKPPATKPKTTKPPPPRLTPEGLPTRPMPYRPGGQP